VNVAGTLPGKSRPRKRSTPAGAAPISGQPLSGARPGGIVDIWPPADLPPSMAKAPSVAKAAALAPPPAKARPLASAAHGGSFSWEQSWRSRAPALKRGVYVDDAAWAAHFASEALVPEQNTRISAEEIRAAPLYPRHPDGCPLKALGPSERHTQYRSYGSCRGSFDARRDPHLPPSGWDALGPRTPQSFVTRPHLRRSGQGCVRTPARADWRGPGRGSGWRRDNGRCR